MVTSFVLSDHSRKDGTPIGLPSLKGDEKKSVHRIGIDPRHLVGCRQFGCHQASSMTGSASDRDCTSVVSLAMTALSTLVFSRSSASLASSSRILWWAFMSRLVSVMSDGAVGDIGFSSYRQWQLGEPSSSTTTMSVLISTWPERSMRSSGTSTARRGIERGSTLVISGPFSLWNISSRVGTCAAQRVERS
ncbi:hypothetical protein MSMEI_1095 [Mycolicibacterium smegmatis MC2 155]|uniref:Uncharacterized protein n=1 Tax=Mycolicibacterium smegmatis (strain ATCC 700084 / mc(2)155) TaxID=246196 RepID=I7F7M5_MYCS2|nr:hypothetical protein MSMEI_1095 [Mycolicibacterium smegmatis MC2 155]